MAYCFIEKHVNVPGTMWCECGSLVAGTPIDGYNVLAYLGHGTSGDVYLAEQPALNNRKVVIKIAHRAWNQADIDNFRREAELLASLSHPYILPIYAYGVIVERQSSDFSYSPYLVLSYAEQGSLEDAFIRSGKRPLPLTRVVSVAQEVAEALDYAHSRGVLHRDVKPANLLSMGSHVLLSDFSVASLIDVEASHVNAPLAGSPAYMAPEVWRHNPGRYSDQYALAVTCFRLLAGDYPWGKMNEGDVQEWLHMHCHVPPRSLQAYRPNLPGAVDLVLQMGMAKDPHKRYENVQAFAADLLEASEDRTQTLDKRELAGVMNASPRPLPLDVQTAGKEWQWAARSIAMKGISTVEEQRKVGVINPVSAFPAFTDENDDPITAAIEPDAINRVPTFLAKDPTRRWLWGILVLDGLITVLLAAEAYWQSKNSMSAVNLLLALWPSVLIGLLLTRWFRRIHLETFTWSVFWGVFFGMTNALLSGFVCYIWVALANTFPHWGHDWKYPGDGLHIFVTQLVNLAQPALTPLLLGLWLAVLGGALLGISIYRNRRREEAAISQLSS